MEDFTEFKIFQQTDIIDNFISHLENGTMGLQMAEDWYYQREGNVIHFKLKPGREVRFDILIWFGFFTRD